MSIPAARLVWLSLALPALLAACVKNTPAPDMEPPPPPATPEVEAPVEPSATSEEELLRRYTAAVSDAAVPEVSEISNELVAITPDNGSLRFDEDGRLAVVTWTSWGGYDALAGAETTVGVDVWVTVAPQLQGFCAAAAGAPDEVVLRMEQLLGLPPHTKKDRIVELWVLPSDLFRPAPDREVGDNVASLEFPAGTPDSHKAWIEGLRASSYGEKGYPWTQLGYTYDWGNEASEVGLSEFVVSKGATVLVEGVTPVGDYCQLGD